MAEINPMDEFTNSGIPDILPAEAQPAQMGILDKLINYIGRDEQTRNTALQFANMLAQPYSVNQSPFAHLTGAMAGSAEYLKKAKEGERTLQTKEQKAASDAMEAEAKRASAESDASYKTGTLSKYDRDLELQNRRLEMDRSKLTQERLRDKVALVAQAEKLAAEEADLSNLQNSPGRPTRTLFIRNRVRELTERMLNPRDTSSSNFVEINSAAKAVLDEQLKNDSKGFEAMREQRRGYYGPEFDKLYPVTGSGKVGEKEKMPSPPIAGYDPMGGRVEPSTLPIAEVKSVLRSIRAAGGPKKFKEISSESQFGSTPAGISSILSKLKNARQYASGALKIEIDSTIADLESDK